MLGITALSLADLRPRSLGVRSRLDAPLQQPQLGQLSEQVHMPRSTRMQAGSGHAGDLAVAEIDDNAAETWTRFRIPPGCT